MPATDGKAPGLGKTACGIESEENNVKMCCILFMRRIFYSYKSEK